MTTPYLNRTAAAKLLQQAQLDALVIAEPEGFKYATGFSAGVPALFRRAGAAFAVVPADTSKPTGAVIGDLYAADLMTSTVPLKVRSHPLWIELAALHGKDTTEPIEQQLRDIWQAEGRGSNYQRPNPFDISLALAALRDLLQELGLTQARLGFDLDFVSANAARAIVAALPEADISDGTMILDRLRAVKTPDEIAKLRLGLELSEAGLHNLIAETRLGQSAEDLRQHFRKGVAAEAIRRGITTTIPSWEYISIGTDPWRPGGLVAAGAVIKADVGCVIDGYSSDCSRNFVVGAVNADQQRLHRHIETAFAAGLAQMKPGNKLADVYHAATSVLHQAGLVGYSRGHIGHGLGHAVFSEQWPFIAADAEVLIEENMVLAYEIPLYVTGFGGFNLEDQILVTQSGFEPMNKLPHDLGIIPVRP